MNIIASREFQSNYQRLVEPVVVKAKSRTLGTWYPDGTEPDVTIAETAMLLRQRDEAIAEAHALRRKIEMPDKTGAPVMKPTHLHDEVIDGKVVKVAGPRVVGPTANVRAKVPTQVQVGTASYSSRPFTPAPKGK